MSRGTPGDDGGASRLARPHRSSPSRMVVITVFPHPSPAGTTGPTRTFGVEEGLLLVDAVRAHAAAVRSSPATAAAHAITTELQQEQIEVAGPPLTGLADQSAAIRHGRGLAGTAARAVGARAVALALVETASRQWRAGLPAPPVSGAQLRTWSWQAGRAGVEGPLIGPASAAPAPAGDVVAELLAVVHPVLAEWGEAEQVESVVAGVLRDGSGARRQRAAFAARQDPLDVERRALEDTRR
ncbi:hypothetical protein ACFYE1_06190 [Kocuria sp. CPCC 205315]